MAINFGSKQWQATNRRVNGLEKEAQIVYPIIDSSGESNSQTATSESQQHEITIARPVYKIQEYPQTNSVVSGSLSLVGLLIVAISVTIAIYRKVKQREVNE